MASMCKHACKYIKFDNSSVTVICKKYGSPLRGFGFGFVKLNECETEEDHGKAELLRV